MISIPERKIHLLVYIQFKSLRRTSKLTNIYKSLLSRWLKEDGLTLKYNNNKNKNNQNQFISDITKLILEMNPYFIINEILKIITEKHNIPCSYGLLRYILLKDLNFSYKKIKYTHYTDENLINKKRKEFIDEFKKIYKPDSFCRIVRIFTVYNSRVFLSINKFKSIYIINKSSSRR